MSPNEVVMMELYRQGRCSN